MNQLSYFRLVLKVFGSLNWPNAEDIEQRLARHKGLEDEAKQLKSKLPPAPAAGADL